MVSHLTEFQKSSISLPISKACNVSIKKFGLVQHVSPGPKTYIMRTKQHYCNQNGLKYNENVKTRQNPCQREHIAEKKIRQYLQPTESSTVETHGHIC